MVVTRILVASAALAACVDSNPAVISSQREPILGGTPAAPGQFRSVVWLFESVAGALCTGTLISPTVVLTAAHCIDPVENNRPGGISQVIADELVGFDHTTFTSSDGVGVSNIIEDPNHPDFSMPGTLGHDDIALVVLKTPKLDRLPVPVNLSADTMIGTSTTQVGYGIHDATNQAGIEYFLTDKMVVTCGSNGNDDNMICFDETNGSGQCNGDSGGPALDPAGHIIGVVSYGDLGCHSFGADTRPSQTKAFIVANVPELADGNCGANGVCNLGCAADPDCTATTPPVCGNGKIEGAEECDDGAKNGTAGDTCSALCKTVSGQVCGDGLVEGDEECDDGTKNGEPGDTCSRICKLQDVNANSGGGGCSSTRSPLGLGALLAPLAFIVRRRRQVLRARHAVAEIAH